MNNVAADWYERIFCSWNMHYFKQLFYVDVYLNVNTAIERSACTCTIISALYYRITSEEAGLKFAIRSQAYN